MSKVYEVTVNERVRASDYPHGNIRHSCTVDWSGQPRRFDQATIEQVCADARLAVGEGYLEATVSRPRTGSMWPILDIYDPILGICWGAMEARNRAVQELGKLTARRWLKAQHDYYELAPRWRGSLDAAICWYEGTLRALDDIRAMLTLIKELDPKVKMHDPALWTLYGPRMEETTA